MIFDRNNGNTYVVDLITKSGFSIRDALVYSKYGKAVNSSRANDKVFMDYRARLIKKNETRFYSGSYQSMKTFKGYCLNIKDPSDFYVIKVSHHVS